MSLGTIRIGHLEVTKLILGGNPFSGFSHQSPAVDLEMKRYYTTNRIKETLRRAEELGINTHIGRADHHVIRLLLEYWDGGGTIQWIAQTCPLIGSISLGIRNAIEGGAKACFIHGGVMDFLLAHNDLTEVPSAIAQIRDAGMVAGIAGHNPKVFEWADGNVDVDFYMCSYYDSAPRAERAEHVAGMEEHFVPEHRDTMVGVIHGLSKPAIHYKVMAAGRNDPRDALAFVARHLRPEDAVCIGIYTKHHSRMLEEDLELLEMNVRKVHV